MMAGVKGADTKPELFLRKALHREGLRYRLGGSALPGKPDLVFPSRSAVVFVHGCFWHRHGCSYFKWPTTNKQFWEDKLNANVARDKRAKLALKKLGWTVFEVWECALRKNNYALPNPTIDRLSKKLLQR
jgi:DNA mismatch endonuclease (patch repair protein)